MFSTKPYIPEFCAAMNRYMLPLLYGMRKNSEPPNIKEKIGEMVVGMQFFLSLCRKVTEFIASNKNYASKDFSFHFEPFTHVRLTYRSWVMCDLKKNDEAVVARFGFKDRQEFIPVLEFGDAGFTLETTPEHLDKLGDAMMKTFTLLYTFSRCHLRSKGEWKHQLCYKPRSNELQWYFHGHINFTMLMNNGAVTPEMNTDTCRRMCDLMAAMYKEVLTCPFTIQPVISFAWLFSLPPDNIVDLQQGMHQLESHWAHLSSDIYVRLCLNPTQFKCRNTAWYSSIVGGSVPFFTRTTADGKRYFNFVLVFFNKDGPVKDWPLVYMLDADRKIVWDKKFCKEDPLFSSINAVSFVDLVQKLLGMINEDQYHGL